MSSILFPLSFHLVIFVGTVRREDGARSITSPYFPLIYRLFTPYLPFLYPLFTIYLPLIYPFFTPYSPLIYPFFTPYLPLMYPLFTTYLPLIYRLFTPYLPLIYRYLPLICFLFTPYLPLSSYLPPIHPLFECEPVHPCFIFHVQAAYWIFSGIPNENMRKTIRRQKTIIFHV